MSLNIVMLYPKRYYDKHDAEKSILKLLSALFSPNINAYTKLEILEKNYDILLSKEEESEVENMCTFSEAIESNAREAGLEQGLSQGLVEGREQGIAQGRNQAILKLLSKGMSNDFILDLGYTQEEINAAKVK